MRLLHAVQGSHAVELVRSKKKMLRGESKDGDGKHWPTESWTKKRIQTSNERHDKN